MTTKCDRFSRPWHRALRSVPDAGATALKIASENNDRPKALYSLEIS